MEFDVYLDESGDLGWSLDFPFRHGGSSQFFTIAYLILPTAKNKFINRYIRQFNKKRGSHKELKGASFSNGRAKVVSREIMRLMNWHEDMVLGAVTVRKANVPNQLVNTGNDDILYNYMVQVSVCPKLLKCTKAISSLTKEVCQQVARIVAQIS